MRCHDCCRHVWRMRSAVTETFVMPPVRRERAVPRRGKPVLRGRFPRKFLTRFCPDQHCTAAVIGSDAGVRLRRAAAAYRRRGGRVRKVALRSRNAMAASACQRTHAGCGQYPEGVGFAKRREHPRVQVTGRNAPSCWTNGLCNGPAYSARAAALRGGHCGGPQQGQGWQEPSIYKERQAQGH